MNTNEATESEAKNLGTIPENNNRRQQIKQPEPQPRSTKALSESRSMGANESFGDMRNRTFQQDDHNSSFTNHQSLNKSMRQQAKLEAQLMMEKKRNVKQSKQNME